jgi:hypothetical protein
MGLDEVGADNLRIDNIEGAPNILSECEIRIPAAVVVIAV